MRDLKLLKKELIQLRKTAAISTVKANKLSCELASIIKSEMNQNRITLKRLAEKTKLPMSQIVNWLCGNSQHCIPSNIIDALWKAARNPRLEITITPETES